MFFICWCRLVIYLCIFVLLCFFILFVSVFMCCSCRVRRYVFSLIVSVRVFVYLLLWFVVRSSSYYCFVRDFVLPSFVIYVFMLVVLFVLLCCVVVLSCCIYLVMCFVYLFMLLFVLLCVVVYVMLLCLCCYCYLFIVVYVFILSILLMYVVLSLFISGVLYLFFYVRYLCCSLFWFVPLLHLSLFVCCLCIVFLFFCVSFVISLFRCVLISRLLYFCLPFFVYVFLCFFTCFVRSVVLYFRCFGVFVLLRLPLILCWFLDLCCSFVVFVCVLLFLRLVFFS